MVFHSRFTMKCFGARIISRTWKVWGKQEIYKDPIAVGIARNGDRHLICRWGMDKLIPFESIKNRSWLYHMHNFGMNVLTSEMFWLTSAAVAVFGIALIAIW